VSLGLTLEFGSGSEFHRPQDWFVSRLRRLSRSGAVYREYLLKYDDRVIVPVHEVSCVDQNKLNMPKIRWTDFLTGVD
jgi:hypothetical protein